MKTLKFLAIAILLFPLFTLNSCKVGENDPFLSLRSRNNRISATWKLESGAYANFADTTVEFVWNDKDCEDADFIGIPEYNLQITEASTFTFSHALMNFNTQLSIESDELDEINGHDISVWEDANTYTRGIEFSYEITIKKNGTYETKIIYRVYEPNYPQQNDAGGKPQWGKTYSGEYTYTDSWFWQDNSQGNKAGITFQGFPLPDVSVGAKFDLVDDKLIKNFINGVYFINNPITFNCDKLENKALTLVGSSNDYGFYLDEDNEYEATLPGGEIIDCKGKLSTTLRKNTSYSFQFSSNGSNVDE